MWKKVEQPPEPSQGGETMSPTDPPSPLGDATYLRGDVTGTMYAVTVSWKLPAKTVWHVWSV